MWSNYKALGYLDYAIRHYNKIAGEREDTENMRKLTEDEECMIMSCMKYAFDMLTEEEAYERG